MAIKRDAVLVRHYAAQLGLTVNIYTKGKAQHFVFLRPNKHGNLEPASVNTIEYDIVGVNAALAWIYGYTSATLSYRA